MNSDIKLVSELIAYSFEKYGDQTAVTYFCDKTSLTTKNYKELNRDVKRLAYYLEMQGLASTPICLIGDCSYEWIVSFYAIIWMGAYPVLIENGLSTQETLDLVKKVNSSTVLMDISKTNLSLVDELNNIGITVSGLRKTITNKMTVTVWVEDIIIEEKREKAYFASCNVDDTALIVFTSGTTGANKAVMLSHRNLCSDLIIAENILGKNKQSSTVAILPVNHMLQITAGIMMPIYVGVPIGIGKGRRFFLNSLKQFSPSVLVLVPAVVEMIRKKIWAEARLNGKENSLKVATMLSGMFLKIGIDLRRTLFRQIHQTLGGNLKTVLCGGAPISIQTVKEFRAWGIDIYGGYGITECSPIVSCNTKSKSKDGSVGLVNNKEIRQYCEVKIVDDEVCIRGDIVMKGYYNDETATYEAFCDGYFKTGDLGYIDKDGFLFIKGRSKNLIILENGENVSPEELEHFFSKIEGIKDLLVCTKEVGGKTILRAIVVPTEDYKNKEALQQYYTAEFTEISSKLPSHKRIYVVDIRTKDFIMSSSGKIKRIEENYQLC